MATRFVDPPRKDEVKSPTNGWPNKPDMMHREQHGATSSSLSADMIISKIQKSSTATAAIQIDLMQSFMFQDGKWHVQTYKKKRKKNNN